ncbi:MAG: hypothetical protein ACREDC_01935 [Bradyrhizobium sp.]
MTNFIIIPVAGEEIQGEIDWGHDPGFRSIKTLVEPLLGLGEPFEHVTVLHEGRRVDMFVSELGRVSLATRAPLPINPRATKIYRCNWLTEYPDDDPNSLPAIAGVAVLFLQRVWF